MSLVGQAGAPVGPWPFDGTITLDPATTKGLIYLTVLLALAGVALATGPGRLLRWALAKLWNGLRRFVRAVLRALLEVAAYLGYQGRRLVFFLAYVGWVLLNDWLFGWQVAAKWLGLGLLIAWTSPVRRRMRQARMLVNLDKRLGQMEANLGQQVTGLGNRLAGWFRQATTRPAPAPAAAGGTAGPAAAGPPPPPGPFNWAQPPPPPPGSGVPPGPVYSPPAPPPSPSARPAPAARPRRRSGGFRPPSPGGSPWPRPPAPPAGPGRATPPSSPPPTPPGAAPGPGSRP